MQHRARSEDDIPTRNQLVIDTAAEDFFAVGWAMNDVVPADEELAGWWAAQRRRELSRYVVAAVVVCFVIMAASVAHLG